MNVSRLMNPRSLNVPVSELDALGLRIEPIFAQRKVIR